MWKKLMTLRTEVFKMLEKIPEHKACCKEEYKQMPQWSSRIRRVCGSKPCGPWQASSCTERFLKELKVI